MKDFSRCERLIQLKNSLQLFLRTKRLICFIILEDLLQVFHVKNHMYDLQLHFVKNEDLGVFDI